MGRSISLLTILTFSLSGLRLVHGQGMRNPPVGANALGQSGAFIAQADDPSAVVHNPAGLIQLEGNQWLVGFNQVISHTHYQGNIFSADKKFLPTILPYAFFSSDLGKEKFRFGLGISFPYGQGTKWSQETARKWNYTSPYYAGMQTADITAAACWQLAPNLSAAVALHTYSSRLAVNNLLLLPVGEVESKLRATGTSVTPAFGLLFQMPQYSFGLTYQAKFSINHTGKMRFLNLGELPAQASINFPAIAGVGFAFRPYPNWKIEFDGEWIGYATLKEIQLLVGGLSQPQSRQWHDCYTFSLGTQYQPDHRLWRLQAGLAYIQTPVPASNLEPTLPDASRLAFSLAGERKFSRTTLAASLTTSFFKKRMGQSDAPFDGQYTSQAYFLNLTCHSNF
ncbi:MAG: outer membrane protein transport protein [Candidatus Omnitrophica bacterium]|nr:outer membrane protein transport protein [Candidatus Omnitrophota bacterium]